MSVNQNCVLYVEPNYNTEMQTKYNQPHYVHNAEDYCIYVDLQVQIYDTLADGVSTNGNKTIHWSWKTSSDGNTSASFMQGKKFKYQNNSNDKFYALTTDYVDTYFDDVVRDNTDEQSVNPQCFGIESINISFDNYTVPCVDIDFTDIRGASLFAPEEYRHNRTTNGIGGLADGDISGSFFKSFMSIPYPKYVLYVKGFYGEPVSYQLTCDKFNAKFDSKTGNFGAHAHFVGYAFSMLTDISLNALVAAPLSDYVGKSYWKNNIRSNSDYRLLSPNGSNDVVTLTEVMTNLAKMKQTLNEENDERNETSKELTTVLSTLKNIESNYVDLFFDRFQTDEYLVARPNGFAYLTNKTDKYPKEIDIAIDDLNSLITSNLDVIKKYYPNIQTLSKPKKCLSFTITNEEGTKSISDKYSDLRNVIGNIYPSVFDKQSLANINNCFFFDGRSFYHSLTDAIQTLSEKKKNNEKKLFSSTDSAEKYITQLGFYPSVANFIKIILAHLETFLAIVYNVKNEVNTLNSSEFTKRRLSDFGITENTYIDFNQTSDMVPAFPKVTTKEKGNNGNAVDGWIGDFPTNGEAQPEANAVNGLLNAVQNVDTLIEQIKVQDEYDHKWNHVFKTQYITIPLSVQDFINEGNPWGTSVISNDDIDDMLAKIFMRGVNVMYSYTSKDTNKRGAYDALNFYNVFGTQLSNRTKQIFNTMVGEEYKNIVVNIMGRLSKTHSEYFDNNIFNSSRIAAYFPIVNENFNTALNKGNDVSNFAIAEYVREQNPQITQKNQNYIFLDENVEKYADLNYDNSAIVAALLDAENYKDDIFDEEFKDLIYSNDKVYDSSACFTNDLNGFEGYSQDITLVHISPKFVDKETLLEKDFIAFEGSGVFNSTKEVSSTISSFPLKEDKQLLMRQGDTPYLNITPTSIFNGYAYKTEKYDNTINLSAIDWKTATDLYTVNSIRVANSDCSLYFSPQYYQTNNLEEKALMFLDNCIYHDLDEFNDLYEHKNIFYTTKICCLMCGAYLWCDVNQRIAMPNLDAITADFTQQHKEYLISYFKKWVKDEYSIFDKAFALHKANGDLYTVEDVNKLYDTIVSDKCTIIDIYKLLDEEFFKNYTAVDKNGLLMFRQSSPIVKRLTKLYFQPLLFVKPLYVTDWKTKELPFYNGKVSRRLETYIRDFCQELSILFKNDLSFKEVETQQIDEKVTTPKEIKIGLYKYLKIIHDKWLGTTEQSFWKASNFIKYWHFIDTFYNDISSKCIINPLQIDTELKNSQSNINVTLITLITNVLADSNVALHTVHNFIDLNNKSYVESMYNMFKPIPLLEMKEPTEEPHFICIYCGESSSKLDIPNGNFKDDSFMLNDDNVLPKAVLSKMNTHESPIPAFGVTFGSEYQSYFTDISVNTESPITTEQSLKAQFMIAGMNNASAENQKEVYYLGQDLFTVYANNSYTCEVTMMGCAWIQPLMYFCLMNVPMFHGSYMITKVSHTITPGNMVTKFIGTRMANTMTPFVENPIGGTENKTESDIDRIRDIQGRYASYENDCPYKKYPVFIASNGNGVTETMLNEEHGYSKYCYVMDETLGSENKYDTLLDALTATVLAECGDQDLLQTKLVTTVMFNRWVKGRGFHKYIFNGSQLAYNRFNSYADTESYTNRDAVREIVRNIFVNTPSVLIGERLVTEVSNPTQIYVDNVLSNEQTKSAEVTEDMLSHMFMFCTRDSYDKSNPRPYGEGPTNSNGQQILVKYPQHFRKQRFLVQHHNHVYTSGDGDLKYWEPLYEMENADSLDENGISIFGNKLIEAVEKTAKSTISLNSDKTKIIATPIDEDTFKLTLNEISEDGLGKIFDILVNTYNEEIKYIKWDLQTEGNVVNLSPNSIIVQPNENKEDELKIYIGDFENIPTNTNKVFLSVLSKHYDISTSQGLKYLRNDCPQTAYMVDDELLSLFKDLDISQCSKVIPKSEYDEVFELDGVDFNMNELISEHFTLGVFCGNGKGTIQGNVRGYYFPKTNEILNNIRHLAMYAEKVNTIYKNYLTDVGINTTKDVVIAVTSGYRYAHSGNTNSQHVQANAIDMVPLVGNTRNLFDSLFEAIRNKDLQCGQLIWEYTQNQNSLSPTLVHISDAPTHQNEKNTSFKYQQGLNATKASSSLATEYTSRMVNNRLIVTNTDTSPFYL